MIIQGLCKCTARRVTMSQLDPVVNHRLYRVSQNTTFLYYADASIGCPAVDASAGAFEHQIRRAIAVLLVDGQSRVDDVVEWRY